MSGSEPIQGNHITEVVDKLLLKTVPLVSVVMISYNHEKYLAQAIDSVLAQKTEFTVELIIGEDCSTDGTRAIALAYQCKHPDRIRVRFPQRNLGVMPNFIDNLEAARGQYIALCEGDDYWCDAGKLQRQVSFLISNSDFSGVFHDSYRLNDKTGESRLRLGTTKIDNTPGVESLIRAKHISTASIVFKKIIFSERNLSLLRAVRQGDYMLSLIIAENGNWKFLPDPMSVYRIHEGGVWSGDKAINIAKADIEFYNLLLTDYSFSKFSKLIRQKRSNSIRQLSHDYAMCGEFTKSVFFFIKSIGPKNELWENFITAKKFWKVFFRELAIAFGCTDWLRSICRKFTT